MEEADENEKHFSICIPNLIFGTLRMYLLFNWITKPISVMKYSFLFTIGVGILYYLNNTMCRESKNTPNMNIIAAPSHSTPNKTDIRISAGTIAKTPGRIRSSTQTISRVRSNLGLKQTSSSILQPVDIGFFSTSSCKGSMTPWIAVLANILLIIFWKQ